jgi:hypothetical protein
LAFSVGQASLDTIQRAGSAQRRDTGRVDVCKGENLREMDVGQWQYQLTDFLPSRRQWPGSTTRSPDWRTIGSGHLALGETTMVSSGSFIRPGW